MRQHFTPFAVVMFTVVSAMLGICTRTHGAPPPAAQTAQSRHGMVVAAEPLAAAAGVQMLEAGGNAVDAAVAVGFALAVTYPVAGNIGGGGFMVGYLKGESAARPVALDFRERAPQGADRNLFVRAAAAGTEQPSTLGHLAAGVPGSVDGLLTALERWGTLDRAQVMQPAIRLARDGFEVPERTHRFLAHEGIADGMKRFEETARIFYPSEQPLATGALLRQPELANTLQAIATEGRAGFYDGWVAQAIVEEMQRGQGVITRRDLQQYRTIERSPIAFNFKHHTVITMPPPSSGGFCLKQMLGMLERFDLAKEGHNSAPTLHLLAEAMRRSFADRNQFLGDPDFVELPLLRLLSREHISAYARSIDPQRATPSKQMLPLDMREGEQTTHYSVIDHAGNAISVTTTLNGAFGCKVVVPKGGFLLNNEMDDFATQPGKPNLFGLVQGEANAVAPGKRPLSSMTPTVVLGADGRPKYVLGTPGGPTIITNVLQVLLNLVVFELSPRDAVAAPKIHHQCLPDRISVESSIAEEVREALRKLGHDIVERAAIGDFQLIAVQPQGDGSVAIDGISDPRGGGAAVPQK